MRMDQSNPKQRKWLRRSHWPAAMPPGDLAQYVQAQHVQAQHVQAQHAQKSLRLLLAVLLVALPMVVPYRVPHPANVAILVELIHLQILRPLVCREGNSRQDWPADLLPG
jgi:hypothetical protein